MVVENLNQENIADFIKAVKGYFRSQQELYGDDIYMDIRRDESVVETKMGKRDLLKKMYFEVKDCHRCELAKSRNKLVFGSGNSNSSIMLVGEAPGFHEDQQGKPFVGNAGQLLDKILQAINLSRDDVFITNVVKCRPPENRDPLPVECETCFFILQQQIEIMKPRFILILGRIASRVLLKTEQSIANLRGKIYDIFGARAVVTYHPAALLRDSGLKRSTWEDVQLFQKLYQ